MAKAILIDSAARTVTEVEIPTTDPLSTLQKHVGGYIETAVQFDNGDVVYVNEEGLFNFDRFFDIGAHQPFAGNGIVVGREINENGDLADVLTTVNEIRLLVRFSR